MKVVQTLLRQKRGAGFAERVVWLPVDSRVKKGVAVSLDDEDSLWLVVTQFSTQDAETIKRGWGLNLPKGVRTER